MGTKKVIDLSKWNTVTDYNALRSSGVEGVIIRLGYRSYGAGKITEDPKFKIHLNGVKSAGIPVGIYFFTTAISVAEAEEEADYVAKMIKDNNIDLQFPIYVDAEYTTSTLSGRSDNLGPLERTTYLLAFVDRCKKNGYDAGIYATSYWFLHKLDTSRLTNVKSWVSLFSSKEPKYKTCIQGWQYTQTANINGVKGNCDVSYYYGDIKSNKITHTASTSNMTSFINPYKEPVAIIKKPFIGEGVKWIQFELNQEGNTLDIDGEFGDKTLAAVKAFQASHKLEVDGEVGPLTREALKKSTGNNQHNPSNVTFSYSGNNLSCGDKIVIKNVNLYKTSISPAIVKNISGTYYIWSKAIIKGRIRICKSSTDVGDKNSIIGWINVADI